MRTVWFHWIHTLVFLVLLVTGAILFFPEIGIIAAGGVTRVVHRVAAVLFIASPILYFPFNPRASFHFIKDILGWEEVQLLNLQGIRTLLALGWVAAGFLYELGVTLDWEEVQLLADLGGWVPRKDRKPGKIVLTRGLRRLLDMLVTQATLERYRVEHGRLPPQIAAFLAPPPC